MKKALALIGALALAAGVANAAVILDASTGNGSFDDAVDAGNTTGGSIFGGSAATGYRAARQSDGTMTIPGWTFEFSSDNGFGGVNFNSSSPAQDGLSSFVINNSAVARVTSDPIAITINTGDTIRWSGYMGLSQLEGAKTMAYNIGLYFDGGSETRVLDTVFKDTLGYDQHGADFVYTGPGATSVQIGFVLNVEGSYGGQGQADAFTLEHIAAVPEPATLGLLGLAFGGLLALRRRRS